MTDFIVKEAKKLNKTFPRGLKGVLNMGGFTLEATYVTNVKKFQTYF